MAEHMDIDDESQTVRLGPREAQKLTAPQTGLASPAVLCILWPGAYVNCGRNLSSGQEKV